MTAPVVIVTQAPVVVVQQSGGRLTRLEKIALGVGLGIGLPCLFIGIVCLLNHSDNAREEREGQTYGATMNGK